MKQTGIKIILLSIVILLIYISIVGIGGYYFSLDEKYVSSIVISIICGFIALVGLLWHDKKKDD